MENWSQTTSVGFLVWVSGCCVSDSCSARRPILCCAYFSVWFISWVLLLLNAICSYTTTQRRSTTKRFSRAIQIICSTDRPPTYSYMDAVFRVAPFMSSFFSLFFPRFALHSPDARQRGEDIELCELPCVCVRGLALFFFLLVPIVFLCRTPDVDALISAGPTFELSLLSLPPSGDGDQEHALPGHGVRQERGDLWWVAPPVPSSASVIKLSDWECVFLAVGGKLSKAGVGNIWGSHEPQIFLYVIHSTVIQYNI